MAVYTVWATLPVLPVDCGSISDHTPIWHPNPSPNLTVTVKWQKLTSIRQSNMSKTQSNSTALKLLS